MTYVILFFLASVAFAGLSSGAECPQSGKALLPSADTCRKYIQCDSGVGKVITCPVLQLFDTVTLQCDWFFKIDCGAVPPEFPPSQWKPDPLMMK
ncbi:uncharacterized protein LOC112126283 [Cimex lectularius]|uniref:Chitin-binding type-2 domain-containing protein n=1 Tax=Cimex lectularius TaxID=79782 RepID=A0A8I6SCM4_CIMLE|nr:uncharacterized protein LOC112126283 [Cimex lectularius]